MRGAGAGSAQLGIRELVAAYVAGTLSPSETLAARLDGIAAGNEDIRAFWFVDGPSARVSAAASDRRYRAGVPLGPLDGVPVAIKDNIDVAGLPCTAGLQAYRDRVPAHDAPVVARLRGAGAIILGKTAMHEGALGATTDHPVRGRTENPRWPGFTPGGSSGGSAAAVAAGWAVVALGTDTMGSVRIPAAYGGLVGLKPTRCLLSTRGIVRLSTTLDHVGVIACTPSDAWQTVRCLAGVDPLDSLSVEPPSWSADEDGCSGALRGAILGVPRRGIEAVGVQASVARAFESALDRFRHQGAVLRDIEIPGWEPSRLRRAALLICEAEAAAEHEALIEDPNAASAAFRSALAFGRDAGALRVVRAYGHLAELAAALRNALKSLDALVTPAVPQHPFPHGTLPPPNQADLSVLANVAGLPGIVVPIPTGGLPASLQLVGPAFSEPRLARFAADFERLEHQ